MAETVPDTTVTLAIVRDSRPAEVKIQIGELPKDLARASRRRPESSAGEHALAGVTVESLPADRSPRSARKDAGVLVSAIEADSPAEHAGLRAGDVLREINRKPVRSVEDFEGLVNQLDRQSSVLLLLNRGNATIFLSVNAE